MRALVLPLTIIGFVHGTACSPGASADSGHDTGGSSTGGSSTGGSSTGGSSTGGSTNPLAGYPDWVPGCMQSRQLAPCPTCLDPECIVCAWGTDEEVAAAGAECAAPVNYDGACSCGSGCGTGAGLCYQ